MIELKLMDDHPDNVRLWSEIACVQIKKMKQLDICENLRFSSLKKIM